MAESGPRKPWMAESGPGRPWMAGTGHFRSSRMLTVNDSTPANAPPSAAVSAVGAPKLVARDLKFYYGDYLALKGINMQVAAHKVTAIIGPSGCGKSTLLRIFNR